MGGVFIGLVMDQGNEVAIRVHHDRGLRGNAEHQKRE